MLIKIGDDLKFVTASRSRNVTLGITRVSMLPLVNRHREPLASAIKTSYLHFESSGTSWKELAVERELRCFDC